MLKIIDVINYLQSLYPESNAELWDPVGFKKLGLKNKINSLIKGVVLSIDLTNDVLEYAIKENCNLIIVHHPFIFNKSKNEEIKKAPYKKNIFDKLKEHKITVYSMHTNYDQDKYGTSYQIAKALGFNDYILENSLKYSAQVEIEISLNLIVDKFKNTFNFDSFRTNISKDNYEKKLKNLAIFSGSGSCDEINFISKWANLIITSDVKWNEWINYNELKINILEVPHLDEIIFATHMQNVILTKFPNLKTLVKNIQNPYKNI